MPGVLLFSKTYCSYCLKAKDLLRCYKIPYTAVVSCVSLVYVCVCLSQTVVSGVELLSCSFCCSSVPWFAHLLASSFLVVRD